MRGPPLSLATSRAVEFELTAAAAFECAAVFAREGAAPSAKLLFVPILPVRKGARIVGGFVLPSSAHIQPCFSLLLRPIERASNDGVGRPGVRAFAGQRAQSGVCGQRAQSGGCGTSFCPSSNYVERDYSVLEVMMLMISTPAYSSEQGRHARSPARARTHARGERSSLERRGGAGSRGGANDAVGRPPWDENQRPEEAAHEAWRARS